MSVNVKGQNTNNTAGKQSTNPQATMPGDAGTSQQQQGTQDHCRNNTAFAPAFGISSRMAGVGSGGELFEKLHEAIMKRIKEVTGDNKTEEKYSAVKILKQNLGLNYSGIAITETLNGTTSAHILVIEKTGDYPEKLVENIAGIRYEITRTPADALDDKYVAQAKNAIALSLNVDPGSVIVADGTLVPNEFDINSESQVEALIRNAFNAVYSENCIRVKDYKGVNIPNLLASTSNGKFLITTSFNGDRTSFLDQSGMPVRQDICVALTFKSGQNGNNKSVNQGNDTVDIVKTYGYIDFEFVGPQVVNGMMSPQRYVPNFIITHIDSAMAPTPDILMLGVASVVSLNEEMSWMQSFRSSPARKDVIDYNDIGALNIEGNLENSATGFGKIYDTKAKTFTVAELNKFVQMLVRPNMLISIDVPKAGPETWYTSVFNYIKFRNSKEAYSRVTDSISTLTNGAFQHNNFPIFAEVSNKIHGGFYRTKDGFEDVRHLSSYLSVANYIGATNQAPALISQYTNTLYNTSIPSELRAAERKKTIDEMSGNTAVYKQFYDRMTFTSGFLVNLVTSLKLAGFSPMFSNAGVANDMFVRRSSADFGNAMIGSDLRLMGQNNMYGSFYNPFQYTRTF